MNSTIKFVVAFVLFAALCVSASYCSYAQDSGKVGQEILDITVKGNKTISTETILSKIRSKKGDKLSQEGLNDDLKRLYATEYFKNVSIDVEDKADGVVVVFVVEEKPIIEDIVFKGNKALREQKLKAAIKTKTNEMLNYSLLATDIAEIKSLYSKKGYPAAEVEYKIDVGKEENKAVITIVIDEKSRVKVEKITVKGNKAVHTKEILGAMTTKASWLFSTGVYNDDTFQEDLEKIKILYDDKGYLDEETKPELEYSKDGKSLYITLNIAEGKQYKVGQVVVKGNLVLPDKAVRSKMTLKPQSPFSTSVLRNDVAAVRQYYNHFGYINAVIDVERNLNVQTGDIDITYNIDPKEVVFVGKINIQGNTKTKDTVIRRELRILPGEKFDGDKIRRSKERLYNLGLFEDIAFDTEPTGASKYQDLVVNVKEAKTGEFSFGGGYSSIDSLLGFVQVTQRNFDILNFPSFTGAGQRLDVRAEIGMVRRNYNISWTDPWIFDWPYLFGFDLYQTQHRRETDIGWAYDERRTGGDLRLGKELTDQLRADTVYRLEEVHIGSVTDQASQDLRSEVGTNTVSSGLFQLTQDARDNVFNPGRGYILNGSIQYAGGILGGNKNFVKGTGTAAYYHTFFDKFVLELKGRGGLANAYGKSDEVPIYERFYAGGANTIRGYRERAVSPRDPGSNDPIGGEAILLGTAEITFPIYEKLVKGAVFYDAGNTWRRAEDFMVGGKYRYGAGLGIRVKTPIGPVKLDYGYPLVGNFEDKREGQFYFSVSQGF